MQSLIDGLKEDHRYMTRLLYRLQAQVKQLSGSRELEPILQIADYLKQYPELWHHPIEEQMFALLKSKPLSAHELTLIDKVVDEHAMLDALAELVEIKLSQYMSRCASKASLMRTVDMLVHQQLRHIECEQNSLFSLCQQHLQQQDWQSLLGLSDQLRQQDQELPFYHRLREVMTQLRHH